MEAIYYSFPVKQQVMNPMEKSLKEFFLYKLLQWFSVKKLESVNVSNREHFDLSAENVIIILNCVSKDK